MKKFLYPIFLFLLFLNLTKAQHSADYVGNFNGTNGYIAVPSSGNLGPTSAITLEAWVFPTQLLGNTMGVIGKNYQTGYFLGIQNSGRIVFYPKGSSFLRSRVTSVVPVNQWTHIAATYDGATTRILINGVIDTSTSAITGALTTNSDSLFLGADRVGTQQPQLFFRGRLDNVRIWGLARIAQLILENRFNPLQIFSPTGIYANLRASFQLDNNALNYGGPSLEIGHTRNMTFINHSNKAVNNLDYNNNLVVNGTTDYLSINNNSAFNATNAITIEAWIKRDTTGTQPTIQNIVNKSGGTTRYDYALYIQSNGVIFFDINSGANLVQTSPRVTNSQWTHIAATYNASAANPFAIIYVNGVYETSATFFGNPQIQNNPDPLYFGGIGATGYAANKFKGQIDEVRIWKVERTGAQIKDNMYRDLSDGNMVDFSFDLNANAIHNGISTIFANSTFAGSARINSAHDNASLLSSPLLSGELTGFSSNYTTSYSRLHIPDNNSGGIKDSIFIQDNGSILGTKVFVLLSHTYVSDMTLTLISPTGQSLILISGKGGSGNDIMTIFSDAADSVAALAPIVNGPGITAPFSPGIKPQQPLSNLNGINKQGWWKLKFADGTNLDRGYLNGWGLDISSVPLNKTLKLTTLIEGFYNSTTNAMVSDDATVLLRNASSPYAVLDSSTSTLDEDGKGNFVFNDITNQIFHIVVKHRNSIETWSSAGYNFTTDSLFYNFTLAASQAFGANQKQVDTSPVKFAIYSGDVGQDGNVDVKDLIAIYNDMINFVSGYVPTDVNGDEIVDVSDVIITYNNAINFVSIIRP